MRGTAAERAGDGDKAVEVFVIEGFYAAREIAVYFPPLMCTADMPLNQPIRRW
jgi:hypothetical protein